MTDLRQMYLNEENKISGRSHKRDISISRLSKLWKFWMAVRWYFVVILFFIILLLFYKKESIGNLNFAIFIVFFIILLLVIMFFRDSRGVVGDSVPFSVNPLPPHLGLDGVSNNVKSSF